MMRIKGIAVTLYNKEKVGTDELRRPIYEEKPEVVENVLVSPVTAEDVVNEFNLTGKHAVYELAIPKDDEHVWTDRKISFFGQDWRTFGPVTRGIEANIPGDWNAKVKVEKYE